MEEKERLYAAIDLKSFYASVECAERGLDPLTTTPMVPSAAGCSVAFAAFIWRMAS